MFDGKIKPPKLGYVERRASKDVEGGILPATVSQEPSGRYFVSVCCRDVETPRYASTNQQVGLDMGLHEFAASSDGEHFENHKYLVKSQKKLAKLQRRLSRKTKGGRNRNKARIKVARAREKVANRRNDTLHKLSTERRWREWINSIRAANFVGSAATKTGKQKICRYANGIVRDAARGMTAMKTRR